RFLPPWPHVEDDPFGADLSRLHHDPGDSQKSFEYLGDAHGALPARLSAWSPTEEHGFRAFLYASPWSIDRSPCMRAAGHHEVRRSCRPHCGRRSGSAAAPGLLACYPPDPVHIVGGCSLARTRNAPLPRVSNTLLALAPLGSQPLRAPTRDSGEPFFIWARRWISCPPRLCCAP